ncbi:MAG TPA: type II secretion system F family protein [Anaerolineae bacterium]|nr:type II secretion system F family protein [Anaerolineae bacterium]HOQ98428.1 type II secretion system F family protein [Anaerolineae bacterium]HPL27009.1 type II secretion system F family protein [Anaerolineae bacterium]
MALLIGLMVALAILALFAGAHSLAAQSGAVSARMQAYAAPERMTGERGQRRLLAGLFKGVEHLLSGQAFFRRLELRLAQANVPMAAVEFLMLMLGAGLFAAALGYLLRGQVISGAGGGAVGLFAPWLWLERKRHKRVQAFHGQLADILPMMIGALRAGHSIPTALDLIRKELPPPACEEFDRVLTEMGLGVGQTEALNNLARRMESDDLELVVAAINISHDAGGKLSHVLEKIADTVMERVRLQGEVRVLTTQQRLTSYLLAAMPFVLAVVLSLLNPEWIMLLWQPGWVRLIPIVATVLTVVGFVVTQRLARIEV